MLLTLDEIREAAAALPPWVRRTPILPVDWPHMDDGKRLHLKCENLQQTGSYKIRAAWTVLSRLSPEQRARGAALSSSGNFAAAFAYAGRKLGIPTTVVMMKQTQPNKVQRTRALGAEVVLCEDRFEARFETLRALEAERGITVIDHMENRDVLCGHATVGLEIVEDLPEVEVVLVPVSTAGLLAGVAAAVKALRPEVGVLGIQPAGNDSTWRSLQAGHPVSIPEVHTVCDALTSTRPGGLPFAHVKELVRTIEIVSEDEVVDAVRWLAAEQKLVVEPGAAVGAAFFVISNRAIHLEEFSVCILLSGGNIAPERLARFLTAQPGTVPG